MKEVHFSFPVSSCPFINPPSFVVCFQLHYWFVCRPSSVIRSKSTKTESQDVLTHQSSFVLESIQFRKEKLVEIGAGRRPTNSLVQFSLIFNFTDRNNLKNFDSVSITKLFNDKIRITTQGFWPPSPVLFLTASLWSKIHYHCPLTLPIYPKKIMGLKIKKLKWTEQK